MEYIITETVKTSLDGIEVEHAHKRWITGIELMQTRQPEVDWESINSIKKAYRIHRNKMSGKLTLVGVPSNKEKQKELAKQISEIKDKLFALIEAEEEIAEAYADGVFENAKAQAKQDKFETAWERGELVLEQCHSDW